MRISGPKKAYVVSLMEFTNRRTWQHELSKHRLLVVSVAGICRSVATLSPLFVQCVSFLS